MFRANNLLLCNYVASIKYQLKNQRKVILSTIHSLSSQGQTYPASGQLPMSGLTGSDVGSEELESDNYRAQVIVVSWFDTWY